MARDPIPTVALPRAALPVIGDVMMDRYRVERYVGTGGMAHVLAAKHVQLGNDVAIKVLDPTLIHDLDAKERFSRESRAMASLSNKHTVRVYDVGQMASGLPYMVMELLIGHDLGHVLRERGSLGLDEACDYIDQACQAVAEAHAAGIIHRDLKPQNLFLTTPKGQPVIRVLDFGIARITGNAAVETITRLGDIIGTLHYMAPEQIRSSREAEARSDVWSLGACLYKLVTGHPPFSQAGEAPLMSAILTAPPKPIAEYRKDVPAVLSSVILRCLRKPLDERFASVNDLRKAIGEARAAMATHEFDQKTDIMKWPPPGMHKETMRSGSDAAAPPPPPRPSERKNPNLQMTMPLAPPQRLSQPQIPTPARPMAPQPLPPTVVRRAPPPAARTATALSFVMIIMAVAIGVFVAGLALVLVFTWRR